jgi:energy-converting hydrogenase Eha subunit B
LILPERDPIADRPSTVGQDSLGTVRRMIRGLILAIGMLLIATFPATWLLMLFLGNVMEAGPGYWGTLPLGILVSTLLSSAVSGPSIVVRD